LLFSCDYQFFDVWNLFDSLLGETKMFRSWSQLALISWFSFCYFNCNSRSLQLQTHMKDWYQSFVFINFPRVFNVREVNERANFLWRGIVTRTFYSYVADVFFTVRHFIPTSDVFVSVLRIMEIAERTFTTLISRIYPTGKVHAEREIPHDTKEWFRYVICLSVLHAWIIWFALLVITFVFIISWTALDAIGFIIGFDIIGSYYFINWLYACVAD